MSGSVRASASAWRASEIKVRVVLLADVVDEAQRVDRVLGADGVVVRSYASGVDEPEMWALWRPGRRPAWAGSQSRRRWELVQHSSANWMLRFVDADGSVTQIGSGSAEEIATVIRRAAITGQARRRLLDALARPDELDLDSPIAISVN